MRPRFFLRVFPACAAVDIKPFKLAKGERFAGGEYARQRGLRRAEMPIGRGEVAGRARGDKCAAMQFGIGGFVNQRFKLRKRLGVAAFKRCKFGKVRAVKKATRVMLCSGCKMRARRVRKSGVEINAGRHGFGPSGKLRHVLRLSEFRGGDECGGGFLALSRSGEPMAEGRSNAKIVRLFNACGKQRARFVLPLEPHQRFDLQRDKAAIGRIDGRKRVSFADPCKRDVEFVAERGDARLHHETVKRFHPGEGKFGFGIGAFQECGIVRCARLVEKGLRKAKAQRVDVGMFGDTVAVIGRARVGVRLKKRHVLRRGCACRREQQACDRGAPLHQIKSMGRRLAG